MRTAGVEVGPRRVPGILSLPAAAAGLVAFAHGSGSNRLSPRNAMVAGALNAAGLGTLLFDLLTDGEAEDRRNVFDVPLLAERLVEAVGWLREEGEAGGLPLGFFGASTGAAAALWAAADLAGVVRAVVSRGGRPDLAGPRLLEVAAPTLLIVGERDPVVIELNEGARDQMRGEVRLEVVPGATHLFEGPGTLERVSDLARDWFVRHLVG